MTRRSAMPTVIVVAVLLGGCATRHSVAARSAPSRATPSPPTPVVSTTTHRSPITNASESTTTSSQLDGLVAERPHGWTSVAAVDLDRDTTITAGAASGMTAASVAKLELLESLLLEHQRARTALSDDEVDTVRDMIEDSDNDAADTAFHDIGGRSAVRALEAPLGLSATTTALGHSDLWGLSTTSAAQQIALLRDLVEPDSPLDAHRRAFALSLLRDVDPGQAWGVTAAADRGTDPALKNGWLQVGSDGDRWAVNSVGVVRRHGDTVLVAVLTQHGASYGGGIARVQRLARAAVAAVA